jgi:formylglycine-generating enzyme required for sulfatase activity
MNPAECDFETGFRVARGTLLMPPEAKTDGYIVATDLNGDGTESVTLDGSASAGSDGGIVSWEWSWADGSATGEKATANFPVGATYVTLTVADSEGGSATDQLRVYVNTGDYSSELALIPEGAFLMGDAMDDGYNAEKPVHSVTVSAFYMGITEVTKAQWDTVANWAKDHGYDLTSADGTAYTFGYSAAGKADDHPVYAVNWWDALKWCNARSEMEGYPPAYYTSESHSSVYKSGSLQLPNEWVDWETTAYRLPTEAEWEKAARGGISGRRFPWGDTIDFSRANYMADGRKAYDTTGTTALTYHPDYKSGGMPYTSPVGSFSPNGYGLYDVIGNVKEYVFDTQRIYENSPVVDPLGPTRDSSGYFYCTARGGGWGGFGPAYCRLAHRGSGGRANDVGFRIVRSVDNQ